MPTTSNVGIVYPAQNASNDVSYHMQVLSESVDTAIDGAWTALPLTAGWVVASGYRAPAIRKVGKTIEIAGSVIYRSGSTLATSAGTGFEIATVPAEFRPTANQFVNGGTLGVAGNLGACALLVGTAGGVSAVSLVGSGTIATATSGFGNHVGIPSGKWTVA